MNRPNNIKLNVISCYCEYTVIKVCMDYRILKEFIKVHHVFMYGNMMYLSKTREYYLYFFILDSYLNIMVYVRTILMSCVKKFF